MESCETLFYEFDCTLSELTNDELFEAIKNLRTIKVFTHHEENIGRAKH